MILQQSQPNSSARDRASDNTEDTAAHSSAPVFLAKLLDLFEIVLKEFDCLLDISVVHLARVTAILFRKDLSWYLFV